MLYGQKFVDTLTTHPHKWISPKPLPEILTQQLSRMSLYTVTLRLPFTRNEIPNHSSSMTIPLYTNPLSSLKTRCVIVGVSSVLHIVLTSTPLNTFEINWHSNFTPLKFPIPFHPTLVLDLTNNILAE